MELLNFFVFNVRSVHGCLGLYVESTVILTVLKSLATLSFSKLEC